MFHCVGHVRHKCHQLIAHTHEGAEGGNVVGPWVITDSGDLVMGGADASGVNDVACKLHRLPDGELATAEGDAVGTATAEDSADPSNEFLLGFCRNKDIIDQLDDTFEAS